MVELEAIRNQLNLTIDKLRDDVDESRTELNAFRISAEDARRQHEIEVDDIERKHRHELEDIRDQHRKEIDALQRKEECIHKQAQEEVDNLLRTHREEMAELERRLRSDLEEERTIRIREVKDLTAQRDIQLQNLATNIGKKDREAENVKNELNQRKLELEHQRMLYGNIEDKISDMKANMVTLESSNIAMKAKIDFLESDNQAQSHAFADLHKRMQEAILSAQIANDKLRAEETLRSNEEEDVAKINFPDAGEGGESREVVLMGPEQKSSLGNVTTATHAFSFDRVFGPTTSNSDIFDDISQLVQSALDGYNVCIFCYGQTGSGKTYTMSAADGMIPRATSQIYDSAKVLEGKGWTYKMEGSFVEVYNENLNDLLGKVEDFDKKKHEIRHDAASARLASPMLLSYRWKVRTM